jgi:hypothetical protein
MALKLFAHALRGTAPQGTAGKTLTLRAIEARRWSFRDLVVERGDVPVWGLAHWPSSVRAAVMRRSDAAPEPLWADTQPWCHE